MNGITDMKVTAIRDLRAAGYSQRNTAEILGTTKDTVREYEPDDCEYDPDLEDDPNAIIDWFSDEVNPARVLADDYMPEGMSESSGEQFAGDGPTESPFRETPGEAYRLTDDYASMSPGDFIKEFFEDFEIGVKSTFVKIMARRADRREKVPTREQMKDDLKELSSGVSKSNASYVAEEYWEEAQNYLEETEYKSYVDGPGGEENETTNSGGWEGVSATPDEGTWVQMPDGTQQYGKMVQRQDGSQMFQPMQPPAQGPPQQYPPAQQPTQQDSGPSEEVKALREELASIRNEIRQDTQSDPVSEIKRLKELQETVESFGSGQQQQVNQQNQDAIVQEIRQLRANIQQESGDSAPSNPRDMLLQRLAQRDDISADEVTKVLDRMEGTNDPKVKEKEIEKEMEQLRMKQKKERTETIMSGVEQLANQIGAGIGAALTQSEGQQPQQPQQQGGQQPQQQMGGMGGMAGAQGAGMGGGGPPTTDGSGTFAGEAASMIGSDTDQRECPECEEISSVDLNSAGFECDNCDYSIMPCPECSAPVDIPPEDELQRGGCPDCGEPLMEPVEGEITDCLSCGAEVNYEEHRGDTIECNSCGHETEVFAGPGGE